MLIKISVQYLKGEPIKCLRQIFAVQIVEISLVTRSNRKVGSAFSVLCLRSDRECDNYFVFRCV